MVIDEATERAARGDGTDEALFQPSPPKPDCPICFHELPSQFTYMECWENQFVMVASIHMSVYTKMP